MTKKEFKSNCSVHIYRNGKMILNAIYYHRGKYGFKYAVKAYTCDAPKVELYDVLYNWVFNDVVPPWYVTYKYAQTENEEFKVNVCESVRPR